MCYPNLITRPRITLNDCFKTISISIKEIIDDKPRLILISRNMVASDHLADYATSVEDMLKKIGYDKIDFAPLSYAAWTYEKTYTKKNDKKSIVVSCTDTNLVKRFNAKITEDRINAILALLN